LTTLTVAIQPAVIEHKVRIQDFLTWLARGLRVSSLL
jgi:hypothetical protein